MVILCTTVVHFVPLISKEIFRWQENAAFRNARRRLGKALDAEREQSRMVSAKCIIPSIAKLGIHASGNRPSSIGPRIEPLAMLRRQRRKCVGPTQTESKFPDGILIFYRRHVDGGPADRVAANGVGNAARIDGT